jgi:hypothetical protein
VTGVDFGDAKQEFLIGGTATALSSSGATSYLFAGDSALYATVSGGDAGAPAKLMIAAKPRMLTKSGMVTIKGTLKPSHGRDDVLVSRYMGDRWQLRKGPSPRTARSARAGR